MRSSATLALLSLCFLMQMTGVSLQNSNTKLFSGNQALDSGTLGFGLGVGATVLGSALLGGAANNNPCGKRKRSAQNSKNTKFFLGSNNNCNTGYPSNNYNTYPSNNYNTYPSNNYNTGCNSCGSSNHYNSGGGCRCTSLTWTDHYGNVNGNCRRYEE